MGAARRGVADPLRKGESQAGAVKTKNLKPYLLREDGRELKVVPTRPRKPRFRNVAPHAEIEFDFGSQSEELLGQAGTNQEQPAAARELWSTPRVTKNTSTMTLFLATLVRRFALANLACGARGHPKSSKSAR